MDFSTLKNIGRQAEGTAKNIAGRAVNDLRRETSITGRAAAILNGAVRQTEARAKQAGRKRKTREGVYILTDEEAKARDLSGGDEIFRAPDGYLRKTPVQKIVLAPNYYRDLVKKIIGAAVVVLILALVVYALCRYNVIRL